MVFPVIYGSQAEAFTKKTSKQTSVSQNLELVSRARFPHTDIPCLCTTHNTAASMNKCYRNWKICVALLVIKLEDDATTTKTIFDQTIQI
jgi:hypothetical protein